MEKIHCKNKIIVWLANKLNRSSGHYVSVNIKDCKFSICTECHKFSLVSKKHKLCSVCYYKGTEYNRRYLCQENQIEELEKK